MQVDTLVQAAWLQPIIRLLGTYGYAFLLVASLAENTVILGLLIPGDAIAILGGAACAGHVLSPVPTYVAVACGVAMGSVLSYGIGARGGLELIRRSGRRSELLRQKIDAAQRHFDRHGSKTVFLGCFLSGFKNLVPAVAGASRMRFGPFLAFTLSAAALRTAGLVAAGYAFGRTVDRALALVDRVNTWIAITVALGVVVWLGARWLRRRARGGGRADGG